MTNKGISVTRGIKVFIKLIFQCCDQGELQNNVQKRLYPCGRYVWCRCTSLEGILQCVVDYLRE